MSAVPRSRREESRSPARIVRIGDPPTPFPQLGVDLDNKRVLRHFPKDGPPRTTVQAAVPREGFLVEIRIIAGIPARSASLRGRPPLPEAAVRDGCRDRLPSPP